MASTFSIFICLLLAAGASAARYAPNFHNINEVMAECNSSGSLEAPGGGHSCDECCKEGKSYPQYKCSPSVTSKTTALLTVNDFSEGGDGGAPSECDGSFHDNSEHVVALSTGWYSDGSRCGKMITIYGNGRSVTAKVVDECDSVNGCDNEHAFQPPCRNNIVDASSSVWNALGISSESYGEMEITWSD